MGNTHIRGAGDRLRLATRVSYEQWLCAIFKTRIFEVSTIVEWSIRVNAPAKLDDLALTASVDNIKGVPGEVEQWFDLPRRLRTDFRLPIPTEGCGKCSCSELVDILVPVAERFSFQVQNGRGVASRNE